MLEEKKSEFMELRDEELDEVVGGSMDASLYYDAQKYISKKTHVKVARNGSNYDQVKQAVALRERIFDELSEMYDSEEREYGVDDVQALYNKYQL